MIGMENMDGARHALAAAMERHGVDCAQLSRLIGRNPSYIQQYLQRGSPRQLAERDRALIAQFLNVTEGALGAPARAASAHDAPVAVPRLDIAASAGGGGFAGGEAPVAHFGFDRDWLRQLGVRAGALSLLRVRGDSMAPTLSDGDDIMVDGGDAAGGRNRRHLSPPRAASTPPHRLHARHRRPWQRRLHPPQPRFAPRWAQGQTPTADSLPVPDSGPLGRPYCLNQ